jgi:hypothetical protein
MPAVQPSAELPAPKKIKYESQIFNLAHGPSGIFALLQQGDV